jgi:uncharacterized membrane protein YedE/YeeE
VSAVARAGSSDRPVGSSGRRGLPLADFTITLVLLALFGAALVSSSAWSVKAALFPRFVTGVGLALAVMHLIAIVVTALQRRPVEASPVPADDDDTAAGVDTEYVFANAGRAAWASALLWVAGFFVLLYVLGLFLAAPLFAVTYLRLSAERTWLFSIVYAAVIGAVLYIALEFALQVSTPPGFVL